MEDWSIFESASGTAVAGGAPPQPTEDWSVFESAFPSQPQQSATPENFDYLNGDLSQTEGFSETSPEWQSQMAKLQEGWQQASQPDTEAEARATEWWRQKELEAQAGELPADATELERLTFARRKELITGEPSDNPVPALQAAFENEADPELKKQRLAELQVAQRIQNYRRTRLAGAIADMKWTGKTPDQVILEERAAVEAGLGPDMALANAPIMRGATTGVANAASSVAEAALRILPGEGAPSELADKLGRQRMQEGQRQSLLDSQQGSVAALPNAVAQMTGEYLPLAAAGVPAPLQVGAKGMNDAYLQSDSDAYALTSGIVQGALTYAGGKLAGGTFIDMLSGKVAGKTLGPLLKGFGFESVEELGQLYGQAMIDMGYGVGDGRMPTTKEALWTLAVVAGARGVGTAMSANIEDDGVKQPSVFEALKNFSDRKLPSRKAAKEAGVDQIATTAKQRSELAADIRKGLTGQQFTEQLKSAATSPEEADALLEIYRARASSAGESFDDYIGKRIKGVEKTTKAKATPLAGSRVRPDGRRGEIEFLQEGTAIIRAFETQTVATLAHETGHLFRRDLSGDDLSVAERWAGARGGKWDRKSEEKFARGFERYLATGDAPTPRLKGVFAKFKDWLSKVYSVVTKSPINVNIFPEMSGVFDRLLTPAGQNLSGDFVRSDVRPKDVSGQEVTSDLSGRMSGRLSGDGQPDILSQAPVSPDLAAKNASMDEARAAMGLPGINRPAAPGANMPHHVAEQEAIRQGYPERAAGIAMDILSDKRKEPPTQLEIAGMAVYGDRLNEIYARLSEDVNNLTLDEGERMTKAAELERVEQDFDLLSRAMRQAGTAQSLAFSQRKHIVGSDYRPLAVESRAAAAKGKKLTPNEKRKINKAVKEHDAAEKKLAEQEQKEAAATETKRTKIKAEVKKLKEKIAKSKLPTDLNRYARDLAKQYLAEGVIGRRELIDKVQKAVREVFPETQRRQVIDAISGYGDFTQLSKDEVSVRLRDLKGQLQQISKLKDMSEGKAPAKTGMERRAPSDTERELIKQVNEAKKEGGYEVTDPAKQLASALSTIKTRLRNQIKDLQHQIDSRQKLIKQKKAPPSDEETKRLTEERDALKKQFDEVFGKEGLTDAQRIANAERATQKAIDDLQKRLDAGDFSPAPRYAGNPIPEKLAKLREKAAALRDQYNSSKPVSLDAKKRLKASIDSAEKSIAELERRIAQGDYAPKPTRPPASSPELTALRERAAQLRAQYNSGKPVSLDEKKRLEQATAAAEKAVAELERRLSEGDYSAKPKRPPAISQKIQVLKDRAAALRKKYAETNPNPPALEAAKERLAVLQAHLKNGTAPEVRPRQQSKNPKMRAIQQQLADARKQLSQSEPAQKARLRKTIGELQAKLEAGNFSLPDGAQRPISPEVERLQYERDKLRRKIRSEINALKPQTVWGHVSSPFNAARSIITTLDFPPVFRQGAFIALGNPVRAAKATASGFRGMFSDFNARKQLAEINARPNAPLYARAKLYLADMDGSPSAREEAFVGRLVEKIPGVRSVIRASERNYTVFLNQLRADTFDAMAASLSRNGEPTMDEAKAIAKFINVATGRGDFGQFEMAMTGLAPVFFSPRYVASRFQLLAGQPLYGGTADTRKLIAKEYGKALVGAGIIYALALAAGAELEEDPTSADFGKIKLGNTRMDPLGGLSQTAVFTSRMSRGAYKTAESWVTGQPREDNFVSGEAMTAGRFLRSKLSPIAATMVNLASGETAGGDKVTPSQLTQDLTVPLSFRDIKDAVEEQGVPAGVALWLVSLFGVGMQTYDDN